jgi:hypothetical protein
VSYGDESCAVSERAAAPRIHTHREEAPLVFAEKHFTCEDDRKDYGEESQFLLYPGLKAK